MKPASSGKRRSISQHEKKKAAKAKIVVPAAKKETIGSRSDGGEGLPYDLDGEEKETVFDDFASEPAQSEGLPAEDERRGGESGKRQKRRSVKKKRLWPKVLCATFILLVVAVVGSFSAYRWMYGDDAADMLGTWSVPGGETPILVTSEQIVLAEDVSYSYELDADAKTISFTFGQMEGWGYYHFSPDRNTLVIMDGKFTWLDTLENDIAWVVDEIVSFFLGQGQPVPEGENAIVLVRAPASV